MRKPTLEKLLDYFNKFFDLPPDEEIKNKKGKVVGKRKPQSWEQ